METTLEACGFICESVIGSQVTPISLSTNDEQDMTQRILQTHLYDVIISSPFSKKAKETYAYTLTSEQMPSSVDEDTDLRSHRFRKNNDFYQTSVRSISNNSFFFPTTGLYNFSCVIANMTYQCQFGNNTSVEEGVSRIQTSRDRFKTSLLLTNNATNNMFLAMGLNNWDVAEAGNRSAVSRKNMNATCSDVYTQVRTNIPAVLFLRHCSLFVGSFNKQLFLKCTMNSQLILNSELGRLWKSRCGLH